MIIGATLLVLLVIVHLASIEPDKEKQRVYICYRNHIFTEPAKEKVLDYEGFVEEVDCCPICKTDIYKNKE